MNDVKGKKLDVMFVFYEKVVVNIIEDNIFETECYDLDLTKYLYYTDSVLTHGDWWIASRQFEFYENGVGSATDNVLDVYF